jgi:hypothetical protein
MGWTPNHGRIKARYNPTPNAAERRHELRLETLPCFGCGRFGVCAHHTMLDFPAKRWRRDHRYQLPVCPECHQGDNGIHGIGSEREWLASIRVSEADAISEIQRLWAESEELERRAA